VRLLNSVSMRIPGADRRISFALAEILLLAAALRLQNLTGFEARGKVFGALALRAAGASSATLKAPQAFVCSC
jgi:hypothetical protein